MLERFQQLFRPKTFERRLEIELANEQRESIRVLLSQEYVDRPDAMFYWRAHAPDLPLNFDALRETPVAALAQLGELIREDTISLFTGDDAQTPQAATKAG